MWWCGPCRKIFVPGNFKQTSGCCFFTRNLACCHLQCCQRQGDMPHPCILATLKGHAISIHSKCLLKTSFGGMHNSRNVLCLLIFLKPAAKPSAGNTSARFPWVKWPQILLNLTWLCTKASQTFSGTLLNLTWLCTKASRNLLRNLHQNPVEPNLALLQSLPEPSPEPRSPVEPDLALLQSLPEPSPEPRSPVEPDLALHQSLPELYPEPCWTYQKALED